MILVGFLVILLFGGFDAVFLRRQDKPTFDRLFLRLTWPVALYGLVLVLLFIVSRQRGDLTQYLLMFMIPVYCVRRLRFKRRVPRGRKDPEEIGEALALALDAFTIVIWWAVGMTVLALVLRGVNVIFPALESKLGEVVLISAASAVMLLVLIRRAVSQYVRFSMKDVLGLRRQKLPVLKLIVLPLLLGLLLAGASSTLLLSRSVQPLTPLSELLDATTSSWVFLAFLIVAVLAAPFFEEVIFRGFFFYVLEKNKGRIFAGSFVAVIFTLMHVEQYWGDWEAIGMVALLGTALSLLRAWSRSSLPGIVVHYVYNGAMTVIPVVFLILSYPTYYEFQARYNDLNLAEKEGLLLKTIEQHPRLAGAYNDLAWIYAEENIHLEKALSLIDQALALEPKNYSFLDTKAEVLFKMGRFDEAVVIAENLVDNYPANAYSRQQLKKFQEKRP